MMMNWALSDPPIHEQLSILKWKWYIKDQSPIGPESVSKPQEQVAQIHQRLSLSSHLWLPRDQLMEEGNRLVLFHRWVSSLCWCKLKTDCRCTRALLTGSERQWWVAILPQRFGGSPTSHGERSSQSWGYSQTQGQWWMAWLVRAYKEQNWKIRDKMVCGRGMCIKSAGAAQILRNFCTHRRGCTKSPRGKKTWVWRCQPASVLSSSNACTTDSGAAEIQATQGPGNMSGGGGKKS